MHASCHGTQHPDEPSNGGLLPYDWQSAGLVSVTDVARGDHPGGEFAFLSACQTATVSATNVDEDDGLNPALAAEALHDALRQLRPAYPQRPSVWAPFTHTGP